MSFIQHLDRLNPDDAKCLSLDTCRDALLTLEQQLNQTVFGQERLTRRVVQAAILNGHILVEGMPGDGKTTCVQAFANSVGFRHRRISFRSDMLPSDLIGNRVLEINGNRQELRFHYGPLWNPVVIADEINRAPAKVQSALLEAMAERQISRIDQEQSETVYHPEDRRMLAANPRGTVFGVPLASPEQADAVPFLVCATQNPVELEGTYPLAEAQLDRFLFKVDLTPVDRRFYQQILEVNLPQPIIAREEIAAAGEDAARAKANERIRWLKAASLFRWLRGELLANPDSPHRRLFHEKPGLWHRVCLVVMLTHYQADDLLAMPDDSEGILPVSLRDPFRETLRIEIEQLPPPLRSTVRRMLMDPVFDYVEAGCTNRGLIDWPRAALAEAFLGPRLKSGSQGSPGEPLLKRRHLREVAVDVLGHRVRLSPQARAERMSPADLVQMLVSELLPETPNEDAEDRDPIFNV